MTPESLHYPTTSISAVVTGASGVIGFAVASELEAHGYDVILGYRTNSPGDASSLARGRWVQADVTSAGEAGLLVGAAEECGRLEVVVNCAGAMTSGLLVRQPFEDWERPLQVNLIGAYNVCRAAVPGMLRRRQGVVVNVASVAGLVGSAGQTGYSASKAALLGFTRSLAVECAPRGVRVNAVAPGLVDTAMTAALPARVRRALLDRIPLGRPGTAEEVARAVTFFLDCEYATGHTLVVDGGLAA